jgi:hypothetical protein
MQDKSNEKDSENCSKLNEYVNNPAAAGQDHVIPILKILQPRLRNFLLSAAGAYCRELYLFVTAIMAHIFDAPIKK